MALDVCLLDAFAKMTFKQMCLKNHC
ncbi:TPA: hypothetical protein RUY86_003507 [Vibrio cholerae]|nr:hypothetical protein [Vibrio cholerae]ELL7182969.1 hypothetical protein [Vibrio cholerae]HDZ9141718.1 hypothetical protein [Vibrio cholerae]